MSKIEEEGKKAKAAAERLLEQQRLNAAQDARNSSLLSAQAAWKDYLAKLDHFSKCRFITTPSFATL